MIPSGLLQQNKLTGKYYFFNFVSGGYLANGLNEAKKAHYQDKLRREEMLYN